MQPRADRHKKLLELISSKSLSSQRELQKALKSVGVIVNQATLSRDLRELGIVKVSGSGELKYAVQEKIQAPPSLKSLSSVSQFVRGLDYSRNIVVIHTDSGAAAHVGEALDDLNLAEIIGTVAGDNTILAIVDESKSSARLVKKLHSLIGS
jgi:transcriptional regulator of arginine metabolism